jgi:acid phosphatase (class A)
VKSKVFRATAALVIVLAIATAATWWFQRDAHTYLSGATAEFVAIFPEPPEPDSAVTRRELDELLDLQSARTAADVADARADRKTEIERFYVALGFPEGAKPELPLLLRLAARVKDDFRPYVRDAKEHFRRLRPYEVEPQLESCIDNVRGDLSYPSGHATFGYVMAYLLREMVPERNSQLIARADEFARHRMVCGVHFSTDVEAGRLGAQWLTAAFTANPEFRKDADAAMAELRAALHLPANAPT